MITEKHFNTKTQKPILEKFQYGFSAFYRYRNGILWPEKLPLPLIASCLDQRMKDRLLPYLVLSAVAVQYLLTRNPHVNFGDSLGFLVFAVEGWDLNTNATSHFLYNNLNHLVVLLLPNWDPVRLLTGLSTAYALLTLLQVYRAALLLHSSRLAAALATAVLGLCFTYWRQSVIIEVYTLNSLLVASMILHLLKSRSGESKDQALVVSFWYGLSLLTHIQNILLFPVYLLFLWYRPVQSRNLTSLGVAVWIGICSVLILLPVLLETHSIASVFFDNQYQDTVLSLNIKDLGMGTLRSLGYLAYNFHIFLLCIGYGIRHLYQQDKQLLIFAALFGLPVWLFAMRYNVSDNYVFFLTPYLVLALISTFGFAALITWMRPSGSRLLAGLVVVIPAAVYGLVLVAVLQIPQIQKFDKQAQPKGGLAYYLWPGQSSSADPLELATEIYRHPNISQESIFPGFDRYEYAIRYLKNRGNLAPKNISPNVFPLQKNSQNP